MSDLSGALHVRPHRWLSLVVSLVITFAVAALSTLLTTPSIPTWYASLSKPAFSPPNWIFGPVWTLLYILMAIAAWLVWEEHALPLQRTPLWCYAVQLFLNFAWSPVFFYFHRIGGGLIVIVLLWLAIAVTIQLFFRVHQAAGWLLVPYLAWVSFATALNFEIWRMN